LLAHHMQLGSGAPGGPPAERLSAAYGDKGLAEMTVIIEDPPAAAGARPRLARTTLPVLAVTGFAYEARLIAGPGITTILAGGDTMRLRTILTTRMQPNFRAVISFGVAGGLDPSLSPGDVVVAAGVAAPDQRYEAPRGLACELASRLSGHPNPIVFADLAGVDAPVISPDAKATLCVTTGALAVDTESHVAAAFAAAHNLPFAAVRVICDPVNRALPCLVANAVRPDGGVSLRGVLGGLLRRPMDTAALARLAGDFAVGYRALRRCRDLLGPGFGVPPLGKVADGGSGDVRDLILTWHGGQP
jgi:adenosylhomocysteine nucleosidase